MDQTVKRKPFITTPIKSTMEKKLQDYIHFYIGQPCVNSWFGENHEIYDKGWILSGVDYDNTLRPYRLTNSDDFTWTGEVKPLLLPLTSLSEEEIEKFAEQEREDIDSLTVYETVEALTRTMNNLRKAGYDCDGLIAAGLAIDKTKGKEGKV